MTSHKNDLHEIKIEELEELGLSNKTIHALKGASIFTLGKLVSMTESDLLMLNWIGKRSVADIKQAIYQLGFKLHKTKIKKTLAKRFFTACPVCKSKCTISIKY